MVDPTVELDIVDNLEEVLLKHQLWVQGFVPYGRASISAAVFENCRFPEWESLKTMNFHGCSFRNCRFEGALQNAIFTECSFHDVEFAVPDKHFRHGMNFSGSRFHNVSFKGITMSGADFSMCNMDGVDFSDAMMSACRFNGTSIRNSSFEGAGLVDSCMVMTTIMNTRFKNADMSETVFHNAMIESSPTFKDAHFQHLQLPEGDIIGWKAVAMTIVKLRIPPEARRTSSIVGCECRAEFAEVLSIETLGGDALKRTENKASLNIQPSLEYVVGARVYPDSYNDDPTVECTHGIHFFTTKKLALEYMGAPSSMWHAFKND